MGIMKTSKEKISDIKTKVKKCLADRKEANAIIDILCYSQDEETSVTVAAMRGLQQVFANFFTFRHMACTPQQAEDPGHSQLCEWLQQQYHTACDAALEKLQAPDTKLREGALSALMKFVEMEAKHPLHPTKKSAHTFPEKLMRDIVDRLLSATEDQEALIVRLSELTHYHDVRYCLMKALKHSLAKSAGQTRTEVYLSNVLTILYNLQLPQATEELSLHMLVDITESEVSQSKVSSLKAHKIVFTACLMAFLRFDLTPSLYRRVLTKLDDKILPFLSSPLLLADFLTQSYNIGGAISLLALNGLFILVHKYNLDYPDFYKKFFQLCQPQIFNARYCSRFFYLADIFLSSTHLPSYLVAAFIKRFARLALVAPPNGGRLCVVFVGNLLVRHPACKVLVHRPSGHDPATADPFRDDEEDPAKTEALESSLWEIKTLQQHYSPEVAQEAMRINQPMNQEKELTNLLEDNPQQMVERLVKKKATAKTPIAPEKPTALWDRHCQEFFSLH